MAQIQGEKSQTTYKLNRHANIVVKTEKKHDMYIHKISLNIEQTTLQPLEFKSKAELADLIQEADLEDEQLDLFGAENEELINDDKEQK